MQTRPLMQRQHSFPITLRLTWVPTWTLLDPGRSAMSHLSQKCPIPKAHRLGGGAEHSSQHGDLQVFPHIVPEDRHADVVQFQGGDPAELLADIRPQAAGVNEIGADRDQIERRLASGRSARYGPARLVMLSRPVSKSVYTDAVGSFLEQETPASPSGFSRSPQTGHPECREPLPIPKQTGRRGGSVWGGATAKTPARVVRAATARRCGPFLFAVEIGLAGGR